MAKDPWRLALGGPRILDVECGCGTVVGISKNLKMVVKNLGSA